LQILLKSLEKEGADQKIKEKIPIGILPPNQTHVSFTYPIHQYGQPIAEVLLNGPPTDHGNASKTYPRP